MDLSNFIISYRVSQIIISNLTKCLSTWDNYLGTFCTLERKELCINICSFADVILTEVDYGIPCAEGPQDMAPMGAYTCR